MTLVCESSSQTLTKMDDNVSSMTMTTKASTTTILIRPCLPPSTSFCSFPTTKRTDVTTPKALYFNGENGENLRLEAVPAEFEKPVVTKRSQLIVALADVDEFIVDKLLMEENITKDEIQSVIRRSTISPVMMVQTRKENS